MVVSLLKNLSLKDTSDPFIRDLYNNFSTVITYINTFYPSATNLTYKILLESLIAKYSVQYINIPSNATFTWSYEGNTISSNNIICYTGQQIDCVLTYPDSSQWIQTITINDDYVLDLSNISANKFIVTITADKTLSSVRFWHNYTSISDPYETLSGHASNIYTVECDANEEIMIVPYVDGYVEVENTSHQSAVRHQYTVTDNLSLTYSFPYVSWTLCRISLKDENDNYVNMDSTYNNYITYSGDSSKFNIKGIGTFGGRTRYWIEKDKNATVGYTISVPDTATITNSFGAANVEHTDNTETLVPIVTYTLSPNPNDATVVLTASGYPTVSGTGDQSITVVSGTQVSYNVSKSAWETETGTKTVSSTETETIQLYTRTLSYAYQVWGDSAFTDILYEVPNTAKLLMAKYNNSSVGNAILCDNGTMKIYDNINATELYTVSGTPLQEWVYYRLPRGHNTNSYEHIQTTSDTIIELIAGQAPRTLSVPSSRVLVGGIDWSGPYIYDNRYTLVFKGSSNNLWERYVRDEGFSELFPTTGTWKSVNLNIQCACMASQYGNSIYVGTPNGVYTITMGATTSGAYYNTNALFTGYNVIDLNGGSNSMLFIASDKKLYQWTSDTNTVTLIDGTYSWDHFLKGLYGGMAISTDGHVYNNGSITSEGGYIFESMYGQIKNYRVYNRGTDTLDTDFKLKYQSIKAPWSFTSGYTGGALRFTTGPSS